MMLYVWRRVYGMETYISILEKKIVNLKKENKELQNMLGGDNDSSQNMEDADIIMNKIFMGTCNANSCKDAKKCYKESQQEQKLASSTEIKITDIAPEVQTAPQSVDDNTIDNVLKGLDDIVVTRDNNTSVADVDIESVMSEATGGVYNRKKLSKMNLDKLKEICTTMNLSTDGTKNILIDRILA